MTTQDREEDFRLYLVVKNKEEQYSIWLKDKILPSGWYAVGKEGQKSECIQYIDEVWTDMRPLSLIQETKYSTIKDKIG